MSAPSLLSLPVEILFYIIKELDQPSQLSLGLTCPYFIAIFANYFHMDRYRQDVKAWEQLGLPAEISWHEPPGQAAIIRYLTLCYCHAVKNDLALLIFEEARIIEEESVTSEDLITYIFAMENEKINEVPENILVDSIMSNWLKTKFEISGGCVVCVGCGRYMLCRGPDMKMIHWTEEQLSRPEYAFTC